MSYGALNLVPDVGDRTGVGEVRRPTTRGLERGTSWPAGHTTLLGEAVGLLAVCAGLVLSGVAVVVVGSTATAWVLVRAARAGGASARWLFAPRQVLESTVLLVAGVALAAAWSGITTATVRHVLVTIALLTSTALVGRWVAVQRRGTIRALVVGDTSAALQAPQTWRSAAVAVTEVSQARGADAIVDRLDAADGGRVDVVMIAPGSGLAGAELRRLGWALEEMGVALVLLDDLEATARHRLRLVGIGGRHLLEVRPSRPRLPVRLTKGLLDRGAGLALLLLLSPLLVLLAVAVRLDSPGPAFFRQTRIGRYGRPFTMFKLRTMHVGAEQVRSRLLDANEAGAVLFKIRRDPRVTRVGGLLRRSSLDELPQLLNVVRGEMSLVGPRPALPHEVAAYDELARRRLVVLPGITGLWQVSGRSDLDWDASVALDVHYADNLTFSGDLAIFLRTVRAVLLAKGAY